MAVIYNPPQILLGNGLQNLEVPPGVNITFTWSEGSITDLHGDPIEGTFYTLYRLDENVIPSYTRQPDATVLVGEERVYALPGPDAVGDVLYYRVGISAPRESVGFRNAALVTVTAVDVQPNTPPTLSINNAVVEAGNAATLNWSPSTPGLNSVVSGYRVQRSSDGETWEDIAATTGTSLIVYAPIASGSAYYYRVLAHGEWDESTSAPSNTVSLLANTVPTAPAIQTDGLTYNPTPRVLVVMGADTDTLSIIAPGFTPSRSGGIGAGQGVVLRKNTGATTGAGAVNVTISDPYGASASAPASWEFAVPAWTDNPVIAGTTLIKAAHINELRAAFDVVCDYYGIDRTEWGADVISGVTSSALFPSHARQLQDTARRIADYINSFDANSTANNVVLPALTNPNIAKAAVINELRQCVTLL